MEELSRVLTLLWNYLSVITFFIGFYAGHRFSLWRDRRKEFNEIAQPLRARLLQEQKAPDRYSHGLSDIDADRLAGVIRCRLTRWRFNKHWTAYDQSKREIKNSLGEPYLVHPENVVEHIDFLLPFTARK